MPSPLPAAEAAQQAAGEDAARVWRSRAAATKAATATVATPAAAAM